jgi:excisionase family DNA binding protein
MKAELTLPPELVEAIAEKIIEKLKPLIAGNGKHVEDIIFTPETLAQYLKVDTSWVYKQVSSKTVPYFKNGKYVRFKKSSIDRWIQSREKQPVPHFEELTK